MALTDPSCSGAAPDAVGAHRANTARRPRIPFPMMRWPGTPGHFCAAKPAAISACFGSWRARLGRA